MHHNERDNLHVTDESSCADPESFFRGGPTSFVNEWNQISLKSGHHRRFAGPTLNAGLEAL